MRYTSNHFDIHTCINCRKKIISKLSIHLCTECAIKIAARLKENNGIFYKEK